MSLFLNSACAGDTAFAWNLLDPVDSSTLHPKEFIYYLTCTPLTSHLKWMCVRDCSFQMCRCQSSVYKVDPSCAQESYLGTRFPRSEHLLRETSVKSDSHWLAKLDLVTYQFLTKPKIIKQQTNQIQIYNKTASILV